MSGSTAFGERQCYSCDEKFGKASDAVVGDVVLPNIRNSSLQGKVQAGQWPPPAIENQSEIGSCAGPSRYDAVEVPAEDVGMRVRDKAIAGARVPAPRPLSVNENPEILSKETHGLELSPVHCVPRRRTARAIPWAPITVNPTAAKGCPADIKGSSGSRYFVTHAGDEHLNDLWGMPNITTLLGKSVEGCLGVASSTHTALPNRRSGEETSFSGLPNFPSHPFTHGTQGERARERTVCTEWTNMGGNGVSSSWSSPKHKLLAETNALMPSRPNSGNPPQRDVMVKALTERIFYTSVPQKTLLRDLLYPLQGIDGTFVKFHEETGTFLVRQDVNVSRSVRTLVARILVIGAHYRRLRRLVHATPHDGPRERKNSDTGSTAADERRRSVWDTGTCASSGVSFSSQSLVKEALQQFVSDELTAYYNLLTVIENEFLSASQEPGPDPSSVWQKEGLPCSSLRKLAYWLQDPTQRMCLLASVLESTVNLTGGPILSVVYDHFQRGDTAGRKFLANMLKRILLPWAEILEQWVTRGILVDPYNEFFISTTSRNSPSGVFEPEPRQTPSELWGKVFHIHDDRVPLFVSRILAQRILTSGKAVAAMMDFKELEQTKLQPSAMFFKPLVSSDTAVTGIWALERELPRGAKQSASGQGVDKENIGVTSLRPSRFDVNKTLRNGRRSPDSLMGFNGGSPSGTHRHQLARKEGDVSILPKEGFVTKSCKKISKEESLNGLTRNHRSNSNTSTISAKMMTNTTRSMVIDGSEEQKAFQRGILPRAGAQGLAPLAQSKHTELLQRLSGGCGPASDVLLGTFLPGTDYDNDDGHDCERIETRALRDMLLEADDTSVEGFTSGNLIEGWQESVELFVCARESANCRKLVDLLLVRYHLLCHCEGIRRLLFLSQGDFAAELLALFCSLKTSSQCRLQGLPAKGCDLLEPVDGILTHQLQACVNSAIASSNAQYFPSEIVNRLGIYKLPRMGDAPTCGWETVSLSYTTDKSPVELVLSPPCVATYELIHSLVWKTQRASYVLGRLWHAHIRSCRRRRLGSRTSEKPNSMTNNPFPYITLEALDVRIQWAVERCEKMYIEMMHFLRNLQSFFMYEVIEPAWLVFLDRVESVAGVKGDQGEPPIQSLSSVDQLIQCHTDYLVSMLEGLFLAEKPQLTNHDCVAPSALSTPSGHKPADPQNLLFNRGLKIAATQKDILQDTMKVTPAFISSNQNKTTPPPSTIWLICRLIDLVLSFVELADHVFGEIYWDSNTHGKTKSENIISVLSASLIRVSNEFSTHLTEFFKRLNAVGKNGGTKSGPGSSGTRQTEVHHSDAIRPLIYRLDFNNFYGTDWEFYRTPHVPQTVETEHLKVSTHPTTAPTVECDSSWNPLVNSNDNVNDNLLPPKRAFTRVPETLHLEKNGFPVTLLTHTNVNGTLNSTDGSGQDSPKNEWQVDADAYANGLDCHASDAGEKNNNFSEVSRDHNSEQNWPDSLPTAITDVDCPSEITATATHGSGGTWKNQHREVHAKQLQMTYDLKKEVNQAKALLLRLRDQQAMFQKTQSAHGSKM